MSWNGSGTRPNAPRSKTGVNCSKQRSHSAFIFSVIGLALVIVAIVAWCLVGQNEQPEKTDNGENKSKLVKEVKPSLKTPRKATSQEKPKEEVVMKRDREGNLRPFKRPNTYRDERGVLRYEGGARAPEKDEFKNAIKMNTPSNIPRFRHRVESEIATLLTLEPGSMLVGTPTYDRRFEQDFINSLMEPIEINDEDSEEDKQIKRDVEATKKELAQRIKEGENLKDIFTETREEVRRLASIKRELLELARQETMDPEMSDSEVKDYYTAVNKLLADKGIAPVSENAIMKRRAMKVMRSLNANSSNTPVTK